MTIDEAIKHVREVERTLKNKDKTSKEFWGNSVGTCIDMKKYARCLVRAYEHEQLAEWLEELKELRKFKNDFTDLGKLYSEIRLEERNKAIDDFENKILNNCTSKYIDGERVIVVRNDIFKFILKQLKDGD